ncbi:MAG: rod shape-determining protein MreC [Dehalococcoidales bacterium]|nr:rod shape-determining protein MreC [Dehalococcoidales bacterium]
MLAIATAAVVLALVFIRIPLLGDAEGYAAEVLSPIEKTLGGSFGVFSGVATTLTRAAELRTENERLRAEVESLRSASVRIQELEHQNGELVAELNYQKEHPEQRLLPANVIAREPTDLIHAITIDKGNRDGVAVGMTVVTPAGLVGRVLKCGPLSAKVLLVTDSKSSVSGLVVIGRAQGMIYGRRQRQLTMRYIDQLDKIEVGQWVVTSSMGGGFPPGIPVGKIVFVRQRDVEPFQEATLEPAVDLAKLETVQVVTSFLPAQVP